jgi:hypothetical protein
MTPAQREKLERLGGAKWIRERIERAKEPNAQGKPPAANELNKGNEC